MNWNLFFVLEVVAMEAGTHLALSPWQVALALGLYGAFNLVVWASLRAHDDTISDPIAVAGLLGIPSALCLGVIAAGMVPALVTIAQWGYPAWVLLAMIVTGMGGMTKSDTTEDTLVWTTFPLVGMATTIWPSRRVP